MLKLHQLHGCTLMQIQTAVALEAGGQIAAPAMLLGPSPAGKLFQMAWLGFTSLRLMLIDTVSS